MVKIGDVWDRTTDVLGGRGRLLAPVAMLAFALPASVQAAVGAYGGESSGAAALGGIVALLSIALVLWGQLTVVGVASDPATTRGDAGRLALRRLPKALLVALVMVAIAVVAVLPIVIALAASGFDFRAAAQPGAVGQATMAPGTALFCFFWGLLVLAGGMWLGARLFLINPVILVEGRGIGALGRSIALTRGLTAKLIGVGLLFVIVYAIASLAAQSVTFIVLRLILGPAQIPTATWLAAVVAALVGAAFNVVVGAFAAQLYVAVAGPREASPVRTPTGPWG